MATLTSADVVNRATALIGGFNNNSPVSGSPGTFVGNGPNDQIALAANVLYAGVVQTIGRQFGWDYSRAEYTLVPTGNTPPIQWSHEYGYPPMGTQLRQLTPNAITDPNNPVPVRWTVGNAVVSAVPAKVIWTNLANAIAVFSNQPPEGLWDPLFVEAVVRLLASELAMAVPARPETSKSTLEEGSAFEQIGEGRYDG